MKKGIFILLLTISFGANAQSLKDLLYSGKLKNDSNSVVKKTDDLSTKIDTTRKVEAEKPKIAAPGVAAKPVAASEAGTSDTAMVSPGPKENIAKSNTKIWKDFTDSLVKAIQTDIIESKKVKKETYYVTVDYEVDVDGQVSVSGVTVLPENGYLQDQLKQRLLLSPPVLNPIMDSTNKPRKVKRKYNFTIVKE